jgi:hypothetical protein
MSIVPGLQQLCTLFLHSRTPECAWCQLPQLTKLELGRWCQILDYRESPGETSRLKEPRMETCIAILSSVLQRTRKLSPVPPSSTCTHKASRCTL